MKLKPGKLIFISNFFFFLSSLTIAQPPTLPNIIYMMADDLGYGELGSYGQTLINTPNIDNMAADGMRFNRLYSGSCVCAPSRAVLQTGLHSGHNHIRANVEHPTGQEPLPDESITLAEILKPAGYVTGAFGKWGNGYVGSEGVPTKQGYDEFYGALDQGHASNYYPPFLIRGEVQEPIANEGDFDERGRGVCTVCEDYTHDLITANAMDFISRNRDTTFFLFIPWIIPHPWLDVPDLGEYAGTNWTQTEKIRAAAITRMDRDVGLIMAQLGEYGIDENTLTIFTSDNGGDGEGNTYNHFDMNGILRGKKQDLYEGGIRVPFIARWPGKIEAGSTSDHISSFIDIMPTFSDLGGLPPPAGIDGLSMLPTLLGNNADQLHHEYLYWEYKSTRLPNDFVAVMLGDWKAVWNSGNFELYNLADDIGETQNLAGQHPDIAAQMVAIRAEAHTDTVPLIQMPEIIHGCKDDRYGEFDSQAHVHNPQACITLDVSDTELLKGISIVNAPGAGWVINSELSGQKNITLYDVHGARVFTHSGRQSNLILPFPDNHGVYFLRIITGSKRSIYRVTYL